MTIPTNSRDNEIEANCRPRRTPRWPLITSCVVAAGLVAAVLAPPAQAAGRSQTARGDDLQVAVDTEWSGCRHGGYFPIRVRITNAGRARNVTVSFSDRGYGSERLPSVERSLTLEANATQQFSLTVPMTSESASGQLQVRSDRGLIPELSMSVSLASQADLGEEQPALLIISDDLTDAEVLPFATAADFLSRPKIAGGSHGIGRTISTSETRPQIISAGTMVPESWVDYSGVDIVALSLGSMQKISEGARSALLKWTAQGGTLIIYDVGTAPQASPELTRILDVENRAAVSADWEAATIDKKRPIGIVQENGTTIVPNWNSPNDNPTNAAQMRGKVTREGNLADPTEAVAAGASGVTPDEGKKLIAANQGVWPSDKPPFHKREILLGRVYSFAGKPFPGSAVDWGWFLRDLTPANWRFSARMGMEHRQPGNNFTEFRIPEVGEIPAKMFLGLITLFTIVIGPVNYIILNRRRQLYLLIVTIPVIAFITSISLFLYALVADGLDVKTRMRSVTLLDQRNREAVSLCRTGFYAGLPPWGGLHFGAETLVLPVLHPEEPLSSAAVNWTQAQDFTNGWLRSRTPTQYVFRTHRAERGRLDVSAKPVGNELEVSNGFPWNVQRLLVKTDDGQRFYGEDLRAGATTRLKRVDPADKAQMETLARMSDQIRTLPPPSNQVLTSHAAMRSSRHLRALGYSYGSGSPSLALSEGTPIPAVYNESQAEQLLTLVRNELAKEGPLWKRSYVATFPKSPGIDCGLTTVTEVSPAHVLIGRY